MISLRETLRMVPEFSGFMVPRVLLEKRIAFVEARIKEFYLDLPMIYIQVTVVTASLLFALGVGLIMPWWVN